MPPASCMALGRASVPADARSPFRLAFGQADSGNACRGKFGRRKLGRKNFQLFCFSPLQRDSPHAIYWGQEAIGAFGQGAKPRKVNIMEKLVYGTTEVDFDALPAVSQHALALRGLTHVLGNEVASKVHGWSQKEEQANSEDRATVKAWKEANAAAIEAKTAEFTAESVKSLLDGTLGFRTGGPRLTPLETIKRAIAKKQIVAILTAAKIKVPTKDDTVKTPDGEFTMAQLVDRRLVFVAKDGRDIGAEITKEAEKEVARLAKEAAKVQANVGPDADAAVAEL